MSDQEHFNTHLFSGNTPCLYYNVNAKQYPVHKGSLNDHEDISRITIYGTPHWMVMRLIARYLVALLNDNGLDYSITSPHMNCLDIDAIITDPSCDPKSPYMAARKIPVQIVIQGKQHAMNFIEMEVISFLTRQLLGKEYGYAEKNHTYIRNIRYILETIEEE